MNSSPRQNSKAALLWTSRTYTTNSRRVLMRWLYSKKTLFLLTNPSKYTLILNNTLYQIVITILILGMIRYTLPLDTYCWWKLLMRPVQNTPWHHRPTRLLIIIIMKTQDGQLYQELSIRAPLILEGRMVMFSPSQPTWLSITDNNFEYFHSIIIRIQQEIILSGETLYHTRLLFHYMKVLPKI